MSLSTDKILLSTLSMVGKLHNTFPAKHLDIGSGHGDLINLLRNRFEINSKACDYTNLLMKLEGVKVDVVDLNVDKLPYADSSFDLITCTEVIEHLEHYRETLREVCRVLNAGGTFVLSTPNILNLKSRIRFLIFGFYNLFGPLHFKESELHTSGGHINPVSLFFLVHSLVDAGFEKIDICVDRSQGTSKFWLLFLYVPIKLFSALTKIREVKKYKTINEFNEGYVAMINRLDILLGRTIIVGCKKPVA